MRMTASWSRPTRTCRIQVCSAIFRARWRAPLGSSGTELWPTPRPDTGENAVCVIRLDYQRPIQACPGFGVSSRKIGVTVRGRGMRLRCCSSGGGCETSVPTTRSRCSSQPIGGEPADGSQAARQCHHHPAPPSRKVPPRTARWHASWGLIRALWRAGRAARRSFRPIHPAASPGDRDDRMGRSPDRRIAPQPGPGARRHRRGDAALHQPRAVA